MPRAALSRAVALLATMALLLSSVAPAAALDEPDVSEEDSKVVAEGDFNSYIVVMAADPLVVTEGENLDTARARSRGRALEASHVAVLEEAGISTDEKLADYTNVLNGFSASITYEEALRVAANPKVAVVLPDELLQAHTDSSGSFLGLDKTGGAWKTGVTGKGVVVGIIDTGIWPEHPSFADNGMPEPPSDVPSDLPCQFGDSGAVPDHYNAADVPFECNNKLLGARQVLPAYRAIIGADPDEFDSARDDDGHGTHTASTAAGNRNVTATVYGNKISKSISGIAPDAHIIAYKGLGNLGGFTSDLALAIDTAVEDGVDVINYSIGGAASTTLGADDLAFLFAAEAGVYVATSAGNDGPGAGTVGSPGSMPWVTTAGANTQKRFFSGTVELGNGKRYTGASITLGTGTGRFRLVDAADAAGGDDLCVPGTLDEAVVTGAIVLCRRGEIGRVEKSLAVEMAGGVGMIMYENSNHGNLFTDNHHVPTVHVDNTPGLAIKAYIEKAGSDARAAITNTQKPTTWNSAPSLTDFSSRGPNVWPDILKPDLTAPGMQILAGGSPYPDPGALPGELFQAISGTSMSSPHVAGLFALLKQDHPNWSPAAAKSALMTTATQNVKDNNRTSQATPFGKGAGHVNPGKVNSKGSSFQPGLVYEAGFLEYLGFLCEADPSVFGNAAATCASLAGNGIPTQIINLNLPSITIAEVAGSQTVTRTVTSVAEESGKRTYRVQVQAPSGFTVKVAPTTITLSPGQSASYTVTVTNKSAPIDQWRFGAVTWKERSGAYTVRSPLTVKATPFDTVGELEGTGDTGTAIFPVAFGYSGDYDAAAHGLIAATETNDNVLQDPGSTFDPADVGAGGATAHTFNIMGADVFRVAIPPEATEPLADLDVYVYDPANNLVAISGAVLTDELVTIQDPADGTWTVYVHGWETDGPDSDYTLYSWIVPSLADTGSLQVTSEPLNAVIGTTGTVSVSWTGAAGTWSLGAVSHHGPGGQVLSRTLLEVDNRP